MIVTVAIPGGLYNPHIAYDGSRPDQSYKPGLCHRVLSSAARALKVARRCEEEIPEHLENAKLPA